MQRPIIMPANPEAQEAIAALKGKGKEEGVMVQTSQFGFPGIVPKKVAEDPKNQVAGQRPSGKGYMVHAVGSDKSFFVTKDQFFSSAKDVFVPGKVNSYGTQEIPASINALSLESGEVVDPNKTKKDRTVEVGGVTMKLEVNEYSYCFIKVKVFTEDRQ